MRVSRDMGLARFRLPVLPVEAVALLNPPAEWVILPMLVIRARTAPLARVVMQQSLVTSSTLLAAAAGEVGTEAVVLDTLLPGAEVHLPETVAAVVVI